MPGRSNFLVTQRYKQLIPKTLNVCEVNVAGKHCENISFSWGKGEWIK